MEMETAVPPSVRKRKMEDELELEEQEVIRACVIRGSKHADGSIYRQDTHFCHSLYRLDDTRETTFTPTILVDPVTNKPVTEGRSLSGCALMQIFSLKLVNHSAVAPAAGPIMLYGFMAARDLLQPLRNYVLNRTRDDPLVLHRDPNNPSSPLPIQLSGPKRAIYLNARALMEYDVRIKMATEDEDSAAHRRRLHLQRADGVPRNLHAADPRRRRPWRGGGHHPGAPPPRGGGQDTGQRDQSAGVWPQLLHVLLQQQDNA